MSTKNKLSIAFFILLSIKAFGQRTDTTSGTIKVAKPKNVCDTCVYDVSEIDEQPKFPGGDVGFITFLQKNIRYPQIAKENGVQGIVFVTFVINKAGDVKELKLFNNSENKAKFQTTIDTSDIKQRANYQQAQKELEKEAIRVFQTTPKWSAGKANKQFVNVRYVMPVYFKLK